MYECNTYVIEIATLIVISWCWTLKKAIYVKKLSKYRMGGSINNDRAVHIPEICIIINYEDDYIYTGLWFCNSLKFTLVKEKN